MSKEDLQQIMQEEWQKVRKSFYYPQLPSPRLREDIPNGQFDFRNLQIDVSPKYLEELSQQGCREDVLLNAILGHEIGHFIDYPGSFLNLLKSHKIAKETLDEQQAYFARESFLNIQNNTNLVQNKGYETIPIALKYEVSKSQGLNRIFLGLYQELWKKDLGVKLERNKKSLVSKLQKIDYLDKDRQEQNFRKFIGIIREYLEQHKQEDYQLNDHGSGSGFSENQIREGIRQFASESKPGEFEQIVEEVLREIEEGKTGERKQSQSMQDLGAGTEKGNLIIARNFYSALAENFPIPIRKKQIQKNGSLYPYSHEKFSISDTIDDLDPFSSPGIIPGITQKWIKKEGEIIKDYLGIPDSLIVIDSSGSMPDPNNVISIPVLGATVIANAYLNNGSRVSIYNFSADDIVIGVSENKKRIHETIRTYQNGGTVFNPNVVEDLVKKQGNVDISIVSDMAIHNLDDFLAYISKLPKVHRVHLFYTNSRDIGNIADKLKHKQNIAILPLDSQDDIREITMGELKKSIR